MCACSRLAQARLPENALYHHDLTEHIDATGLSENRVQFNLDHQTDAPRSRLESLSHQTRHTT
eukprot:200354-Amphidinium_carterae.1